MDGPIYFPSHSNKAKLRLYLFSEN
jgi:hypothetical protein